MSDLTQVIERLGRIEGKQDQTLQAVTQLDADGKARERRLSAVETTVYGNGQAGLKTEVTTLKTICQQRHAPKPLTGLMRGVAQTVLAAVILAVAAWAMGMWKAH